MSKTYTREEVSKHNSKGDLWIVVDTVVYNISKFTDLHPGGSSILLDADVAGQDQTENFFGLHKSEILTKYKRLAIGTIENEKPQWVLPQKGELSKVPFAEPMWLQKSFKSPYYDESHHKLQQFMRKYMDEHVIPEARLHEETNERPSVELIQEMGKAPNYINHMRLGPGKHLHGLILPGGLRGENFTYMHELVLNQEIGRLGARGYGDGFQGGVVISLPALVNFGSEKLKAEWVPEILAGRKFSALAITEAFAGSDVANLRTTAKKSEDGKHWIIRGTKKWITGGHWADAFAVACRTSKRGLTMIWVPRVEGVDTKLIKTSYSTAAGTSYITFDDALVPVENTLGEVDKGLQVVLSNFNHERMVMASGSARSTRLFIEQAFIWAHVRKVFGKRLTDEPVIRQKFSIMFGQIQSVQSYLETIIYQMCHMDYKQQSALLAGEIGLLKQLCTRVAHHASDECVQIFGGRGVTRTGMGNLIEGFQRTQKFDALLGGAEEVLGDLAVRRAMLQMPKAAL